MSKIRLVAALLLAALALSAAVATTADAEYYVVHVGVEKGSNYFGPPLHTYASAASPYGQGIPCSGIRGYGLECAKEVGQTAVYVLPFYVQAEPYIHNHSTFKSYFDGQFY